MDAAGWDQRYSTADFVWATEPNRFLPPEVADLAPGRALDLACGEGRNAVWLATQGWEATGVDFSQVGLDKARTLAEGRGVDVAWVCADVTRCCEPEAFDLVVVFYLQLPEPERHAAFGNAARALAPGGTVLLVGHDARNLAEGVGGPQDPAVLASPDDVVTALRSGGVTDLVIQRAELRERPVMIEGTERQAIDHLVRARRG